VTTRHRVQQGDTIYSLSRRYGVPPDAIWDHPDNQELRQQNRHKAILYAGEVVTVPERELREETVPTDQRHRFLLRASRVPLELRFLDLDEPRAQAPYRLIVDVVHEFEGQLDDDGVLTVQIPADARRGEIWVGEEPDRDHHVFAIGHLDPANELSGVQQRLNNLGFPCGAEDGELGDVTRTALQAFQQKHDLEPTGELDDATRARLEEIYGS
jgi:N-acetylmuramoyl-L-alanine amidase